MIILTANERKEKIKSILKQLIEEKEQLLNYEEEIKRIFTKLDDLDCLITKSEIESSDVLDVREIRTSILNAFISKTEFERMFERIDEFKSELEDYIEELSNSKQEAMETKCQELDKIGDFFDFDTFESFEEVISHISDVENKLKSTL